MSSKLIYLVSSSGYPNYGDELVAAQWLRWLAVHEPDAEVWLDTPSPGNCVMMFDDLHPNVRFTDALFQIVWNAPEDLDEVAWFCGEAVRNPGLVPRRALGMELLQGADVFHVLGGGYINEYWPRHIGLLSAGNALAESFKARAAATGLGLMPVAGSAELIKKATSNYHVLDVRDQESTDLLADDRVSQSGDDVTLGIGPAIFDERETRSVMLNLQADFLDDDGVESLRRSVLATVEAWGIEGHQIGYVECMPGADRRMFDLLTPDLPDMRFYPFVEVWRAGMPARRGQRWLTTRFHVHLTAAAAGAWGVAFPINDYYRVKHGSLVAQGSRWALGELGEPAPAFHGEPGFGSKLAGLTDAKTAIAQRIYGP